MEPDPHKPLRDDVRLLGELLGDTLQPRGEAGLFEIVERVRTLAREARRVLSDPPAMTVSVR